jgi:uncharacterized protein (DUF2147 family)
MDWRLIGAVSAAGGSFCLVAVGAYAVLTADPAPQASQRKSAPAPTLLSEYRSPPSPAATAPALVSAPGPPKPSANQSPFAGQGPFATPTSGVAANPGGMPGRIGASDAPAPPSLDVLRIADDPIKPPQARPEAKQGPRLPGVKVTSLAPPGTATMPESPPRPLVEIKKPSLVPEIQTTIPSARSQPALAVDGMWRHSDGAMLRIHSCGAAVCGYIAGLKTRTDPATGQAWTDRKNADPSRQGRPLVGTEVLIAMRPSGPGKWSGTLYNAQDGKTYAGNLIELGPDTVRVEGCWIGICGGENLTRARSNLSSR